MCRMRSIREVARFFREMDPDTQITEWTIRKMIAEGTIPSVKTGDKNLINLDYVLELCCPGSGAAKTGAAPIIINK